MMPTRWYRPVTVLAAGRDQMNLVKTSLLNGIAVVIKMATLLGINKILAIYVGPAGYAAIGQFQNAVQMVTTFASGAINTGVTKYTAEFYDDAERQHKVWQTACMVVLIGSIVVGGAVALLSKPLAVWFLKEESYGSVFIWFASTLIFFTFNTLLLAILNGKKAIGRYVAANIAGSLFALIVTAAMSISMGLYGALVALAIYQSCTFFVTVTICYRADWFKWKYIIGGIDGNVARGLLKYTAMALTTAACVPLSHIFIRNHLSLQFGLEQAGYWEAMWRLSSAYLMFVTATLSVYYLPRLAELKTAASLRQEIHLGYKLILPIAFMSSLAVYLLRDMIIAILFSDEFLPMRDLFAIQMIGDFLRIGSLLLSYIMLSKSMPKAFILTEIAFAASFYFLTIFMTATYGLQGVVIAHAINYLIYWLIMIFLIYLRIEEIA